MKNKLFNNSQVKTFLENSLFVIIILLIFATSKISSIIGEINSCNNSINTTQSEISNYNSKLKELQDRENSINETNWITYEMWMRGCASISNKYIYDTTNMLKILSEKPQNQLDELSKNFKIKTQGNTYDNVVKFIIIDKSKSSFITNDLANIDFIKASLKTFSEQNGDLFNYVSNRGKWYNISYNSDSAPANRYISNQQIINSSNFVEAYWFPKDYVYSKDDDALLNSILKDAIKTLSSQIDSMNSYIKERQKNIDDSKISIVVYSIIIFILLDFIYIVGKEGIIRGLKYNYLTNSIRKINKWFEIKSTIFKFNIFVILTALTLLMVANVLIFHLSFTYGSLIIPALIVIFYLIFIFPKAIKFLRYIDEIMKGISKITSGELEYVIDETGDKALSNLAHNINKLNKGFKVSIEEQIKNEKLKSELVANVSHDLKTPLTSIINYTDILLREDISEDEKEEFLKIINRKGLKLKSLIDDLFEISKITSGKVELSKHSVDVVELIGQSIAEYSDTDLYFDKHLSFVFKTFTSKIEMDLDGNKMSRVFENLITNALKYSLNETRVHVEIEEIKKGIKISFKNISSTPLDFDKDEILERFVRGDRSRNSDMDGNGLGLAIAKSIVELHGGIMYLDFDGDLFKCIIELYY